MSLPPLRQSQRSGTRPEEIQRHSGLHIIKRALQSAAGETILGEPVYASLGDGLVIRAAIEDDTAGDASNPDYALTARVLDVVHADAGTVLVVDEVLSSPVA